ncbi:putative NAD(P)-binding domain, rmlD-like substrate binding domain-containing protein [Helianthus annuus]|uniref:UDP-glucose 4,6-dehydratase n=1 Tax=Helianthus annuus TaxID=4232 RepID=A0A9K3NWK7_HELAN|nr:putative NAD(P)-binding domain, rmlD-like substrate binding domain-containing protein [Helianthus annuus]KAJ0943954.1 putative NAD(P)-binding domain, rmlD-like substrate binding domain-containing protein [Helianthus annuus]
MANYTPKNILITGAAGFIASHVANRLIRSYPDYKIVVLDKLDYCSNLKNLNPSRSSPNFKFVKGDIGSADLVNYLLITESIDTIMHFAAQTHVDNSFGNSFEFTKNNIYGTHVLLEACKVTGQIRRFIHVSTDEVYGETDEDAVVGNHEASQLLPTNPYSATKAGGVDRLVDGPENAEFDSSNLAINTSQIGVQVPSSKTSVSSKKPALKFLIYGKTGWIGGLLGKLCEKQQIQYEYGKGRLEDRSQLLADIQTIKPTHVFNAAGVTGRPNVDWCESHKTETIRTNVSGTLNLADVCREHGLLMINFATGCIFEYDAKHPEGSGIGFKEEDTPNFIGSFYSKTKAMVEELLKEYDNVCTLRVRMPISSDLNNPRNFITKIARYNKVVNIPNSMTILDELLPISIEMAKRNLRGIWNFTNPGVVSHNEILEMYKKYINPEFKWVNFTLEEQAKVIVAPRSNNELDASKLKKEFPELMSIKESLIKYVFEPNKKH